MKKNQLQKGHFKLESEIPNYRVIWIGVLQGTWKEMGIQYGQRCGKDIARNFDQFWETNVLEGERLWQKGKNEEERTKYAVAYFGRSFKELTYLSPGLTQLLEGIAEGAAKELDKSIYGNTSPHFIKILALHWANTHFHPDWDFSNDRPRVIKSSKTYAKIQGDVCNAFWVKGRATKTGETYANRSAQSPHVEPLGYFNRQVAYVAVPKDPKARVFWGFGAAGNLGGLGGGLMNDSGVCCLTAGCAYSIEYWAQVGETVAPGISEFLLAIDGVIFSKSAREATERTTTGTSKYRKLTSRKTVLRARGCNILFGDAKEAFCIEQNARHYAIRKPGDFGEKGKDYITIANHHKFEKGSFDNNNVFHPEEPMTKYEPEKEKESSCYRFWSGMWMLHNNYGKIDLEIVINELVTAHYVYDKEGNRYDPDPETKTPEVWDNTRWSGTFCAHIGPITKEHPLGIGGNGTTSIFNLTTLEVWWVPVWPCHYKEWNLNWDYLNLKPFSEYRKMLWGY
jgi:hypothetical protein